ncbi:MAG: hypothetical protein F6K00_13845 [Leptolyngbya sp. SIOISBB]|nr:hypothetical protein [Leptolyngbya sp. SIOISBB]
MNKKRMRYQWFQDVPRNVTRREYQRLQFYNFASLGLGVLAASLAISSITGLTLQISRELDDIDHLTIAEALTHEGDRLDLIKVEGFLIADNPPTMPDDETRQVIRGELTIVAQAETETEETDENSDVQQLAVLYDWAAVAEPVFLSDSDRHLPLAFDLAVLPMESEEGPFDPETVYTDEPARLSRPVAIQYGTEMLPLPLEDWGPVDRVSTDMTRQVLPYGQSVVIVAALEASTDGPQLVDPLGDRLQVHWGD